LPHRADGIADVAVKDGVIVAVGLDLPRDGAAEVFDATGLLVTPGLVDTHVHVYDSMVPLGIDADRHCLGRGCTTVVDAGSAGCTTLAGLKRFAVAQQKCRILAFMHVASHGLANVPIYNGLGELDSLDYIDADLVSKKNASFLFAPFLLTIIILPERLGTTT
jgi:predicted amidohydrolase